MPRKATQTTTDLRQVLRTAGDKWEQNFTLQGRGRTSWSDADPTSLHAAIAAVTEDGAGLLLSKTSDGGALAITVLSDGGAHKLYPATVQELHEALQLLIKIAI